MSSQGNYSNFNTKPIDDHTHVKHVIVIGAPRDCDVDTDLAFRNQLITLNTIISEDQREETYRSIIRSWFPGQSEGSLPSRFMITTDDIYGVNTGIAVGQKFEIGAKRKSSSVPLLEVPSKENIKLGGFYDPRLLPDYGGPCFNHNFAQLKQLNVRNEDNELVAPWDLYDALKPGTLVLVDASLHCFVDSNKTGKRRFYQITAHNIRIINHSDEAIEPRDIPAKPTTIHPHDDEDLFPASSSASKRMRMDIDEDPKH